MTNFTSDSQLVARVMDERSEARVEYIRGLNAGSHIHICGVCGTGTASVLRLLKQLGFRVTGSDKAFYPPMGEVVRRTADRVYENFSAENLADRPDLVVIGNAVSRGNPEVEAVLEQGLPFASMPEVFSALLIGPRQFCPTSIVVAGTHGKTTTSAAITWVLEYAKRRPGFFIGGIPLNFEQSIRPVSKELPVDNRVVVLEGDEYDSAFFSKFAKFHSYRPDIAVITSLEFDHGDIYHDVEEIEVEFTRFVERVPEGGWILVADNSPRLDKLVSSWRDNSKIKAPIVRYGGNLESKFHVISRDSWVYQNIPRTFCGQELVVSLDRERLVIQTKLTGIHNAFNILAAVAIGRRLGVGQTQMIDALREFSGVKRRQQIIAEVADIVVLEDFAHHPTAVSATLSGIKEAYKEHRVVAVFEPRSNTSRSNYFQEQYGKCFSDAAEVVILEVPCTGVYNGTDKQVETLDVSQVVRDIKENGSNATSFATVEDIQHYLLDRCRAGDVVVLMSNGAFGGLPQSFPSALKEKFGV